MSVDVSYLDDRMLPMSGPTALRANRHKYGKEEAGLGSKSALSRAADDPVHRRCTVPDRDHACLFAQPWLDNCYALQVMR